MKREEVIDIAIRASHGIGDDKGAEWIHSFANAIEARTIERIAQRFDSSPHAEMFRQNIADEIRALKDEQ